MSSASQQAREDVVPLSTYGAFTTADIGTVEILDTVPPNLNYQSLSTSAKDVSFTEKNPFTMSKIYPKDYNTILLSSDYPLSPKVNLTEMSPAVTELYRGRSFRGTKTHVFEQKREEKYRVGFLKIPPIFLINSNDALPRAVPAENQVCTLAQAESVGPKAKILHVNLNNVKISPSAAQVLYEKIQLFNRIEVLDLSNTGITTIPEFVMPFLRIAKFVDNRIEKPELLSEFAVTQPRLAIFDFRRNPSSSHEGTRITILALAVNLKYLNGRQITVNDRLKAMEQSRERIPKGDISRLHFLNVVKAIPEIDSLQNWEPAMVQHLSLPNKNLSAVTLHQFTNLVSLSLRGNNIQYLTGSGIQKCIRLTSLDLSNNCLSSLDEIKHLAFLDSLLHVWLEGNPLPPYRQPVIFICASSAGTAAKRGLKTIDGLAVTLEETLRSIMNNDPSQTPETMTSIKWSANLDRSLGTTRIASDPQVFTKVFSAQFNRRGLRYAAPQTLSNLTHLSLRGNGITSLNGIANCVHLVSLDVSHNPSLKSEDALPEVIKLRYLQFFFLADDCFDPSFNFISRQTIFDEGNTRVRSITCKEYRDRTLRYLLRNLSALTNLDRLDITVDERIDALQAANALPTQIEEYRARISLTLAARPGAWADLSPARFPSPDVSATSLRRLTSCGLTDGSLLKLPLFTQLVELDLSHNKFKTLKTLGLERLNYLRIVDLSFNRIVDKPNEIASIIDSVRSLEMIALRGNPCVEGKKREEIIGNIKRLRDMRDCFRVLDYEIAPVGVNPKNAFLLGLKVRLPPRVEIQRLTELNLAGLGLSYVDVSRFPSLVRLFLANNSLAKSEDIVGLDLPPLELVDLRNNKFTSTSEFVLAISVCHKLTNIGTQGNPCAEGNKLRSRIIKTLYSTLIAIDDIVILPAEIGKVASISDEPKFAFKIAVQRNRQGTGLLDMHKAGLSSYLKLSSFIGITACDLSGNRITSSSLMRSGIDGMRRLVTLDLSDNQLKETDFAKTLSELPELSALRITGNPICVKENNYKGFLVSFPKISDVLCKLVKINGRQLTLDERVSIVREQQRSETAAQSFRTHFVLEHENPDWQMATSLSLSGFSIVSLLPLVSDHLTSLDLSNNLITTFPMEVAQSLPNLHALDLSYNRLSSLEDTIDALSYIPHLTSLRLHMSTADQVITVEPRRYLGFVCSRLRGLSDIDRLPNPRPLLAAQLNALKDLEQLTGWFNPNRADRVDLSNRNISAADFPAVLLALSAIGPRYITLEGNPCALVDKYRFLIIYHVPDVEVVDGVPVTIDQRMNADKAARQSGGESAAAGLVIGGGVVAAEYLDVEKRTGLVSQIATAGTIITKSEVYISSQQILAQIATLIEKAKWPKALFSMSWLVLPFTIDLSFLSYMLDIRLPFWFSYLSFFIYMIVPSFFYGLYHLQLDRDFWYDTFTWGWRRTKRLTLFAFIMLMICSFGLALLSDLNYTLHYHKLTNNQYAWFTVLAVIATIFCILFMVAGMVFRSKKDSPVFWFRVLKFKKRTALFFLTVFYFPVCKSFVDTLLCTDNHSKSFQDVACFSSLANLQLVHICAIVFGIAYSILIPSLFIVLINKGVREIDLTYRISDRLAVIKNMRKEARKLPKEEKEKKLKEIEEMEEEVKLNYSRAALEYENAAAYLYNGYDRKNRYKKVISMFEKLAYLLLSSFVPSRFWKGLLSGSLMSLATLLQLIMKPFSALSENVLEGVGKVSNLIVLGLTQFIEFDALESDNVYVGVALVFLVAIVFIIFIIVLIRSHCSRKPQKEDEEIREINNDVGNPNEMVEGLMSLNIGDSTLRKGKGLEIPNASEFWKEGTREESESDEDAMKPYVVVDEI